MKKTCESCLMPLAKDLNPREAEQYCSYCYKEGKFTYEGDLKGFQSLCYVGMRQRGINPLLARLYTLLVRFAPRWKKK